MCSEVRAATARSYVRGWRPFWAWWSTSGNKQLPPESEQVLSYLEQRAAEPCAPSVIRRTRAALAFHEESAGIQLASRVSKRPWMAKQADALEATLTGTEEDKRGKHISTYVAAAELLVMNQEQPPVLRCYAFWRCLEAWAALRFSDHRGLSPESCSLNETFFRGSLSRTKTTGKDKKVAEQSASRQPQLLAFEP